MKFIGRNMGSVRLLETLQRQSRVESHRAAARFLEALAARRVVRGVVCKGGGK